MQNFLIRFSTDGILNKEHRMPALPAFKPVLIRKTMEEHMNQINPTGFRSVIGKFCTILALTAVCMAGVSVWNCLHIRPADCYTDQGIHPFKPYEVLPVQVKNTTGTSRDRRMRPTKTVYMLYYRATDGSGYRWSQEVVSKTYGQKVIDEGMSVERRVLSVAGENVYITTEAQLTARSYTSGLRRQCIIRFSICVLYLTVYGILWAWQRFSGIPGD